MMEKPGKTVLSVHDCVTELLIGLLGETSLFFTLNAEGSRIVVFKPKLDVLPPAVALNADLFTGLATDVRNLKLWRGDFVAIDEVKRALIESAYGFLNLYIAAIDDDAGLRMDHISGRRAVDYGELVAFVSEWRHRIHYVALLVRNTRELCGVDAMNAVYREWCLLCAEDWHHGVLETALRQMSVAFHEQVRDWMLNGRLPAGRGVQWMLRDASAPAHPSPVAQTSDGHVAPMKSLQLLNPTVVSSPDVGGGANADGKSQSVTAVPRVEIDWARVPLAYGGSPEFVRQIFVVGRNIQLLNGFRVQKIYDHRLDERLALLHNDDDGEGCIDKFTVWYSPSERARFRTVVQRYADIVNEDVMVEITKRQRLLEHIALIQAHFFLLHGDFSMRLYEKISETAVGRSGGAATHHLTTYKLDAMVTECARYALTFSRSADAFPAELRDNLCASDVTHAATVGGSADGPSDFIGSPSNAATASRTTSVASSKKRSLHRALIRSVDGLFLEDLVRISYNAIGLISEVLTPQILRSYGCVFGAFVAWRLLHCRADETSARFGEMMRRRRLPLLFGAGIRAEELRAIRFTRMVLSNVQRYVISILGYVFDEVFAMECPRSLANLREQPDLPALVAAHYDFFSTVSLALFVNRVSQPVFEALRHCVKAARQVLRRVDAVREWAERLSTENENWEDDDGGDDRERCEGEQDAAQRLWAVRRTAVEEVYDEFLETTLRLRTAVATLCLADVKQSPHWRHFEPNPLLVPPERLRPTPAQGATSVEVVG